MAQFNFWSPERQTFEGYLRTRREDWTEVVDAISNEVEGRSRFLDIGSGDGHTTRQILSRLDYSPDCQLIEPDKTALAKSLIHLQPCDIPIGYIFCGTLADYLDEYAHNISIPFNTAFAIQTNYYWGMDSQGRHSIRRYEKCLKGLDKLTRNLLVLTNSLESDYNSIVENPFPEWTSSEYLKEFYRARGRDVSESQFKMRFYVEDIFKDRFAARELYKFFNNTEREPSKAKLEEFVDKTEQVQKGGYVDFRDVLIKVSREEPEEGYID